MKLPAGWTRSTLGDLCRTKPNNGIFRKNAEYESNGEGMPVVWVKELFRGNQIDVEGSRRVKATAQEVNKYGLKYGDVLFCRSSLNVDGIAFNNVYLGDDDKALFECHLIRVSPDLARVFPPYLNLLLRSPSLRAIAISNANTATMTTIDQAALCRIEVDLPPLPEQRRIAAILDQADAIRRKRQKAIELTEKFLKSAFLEMFGDPVTNPKGWKTVNLDSIADIQSGVTKGRRFNGKETVHVPYMRVANVQDGRIVLDEVKEIEVLPSDVEKYLLQKGDVLLTEGGDFDKLGRGAVWHAEIANCIHQNHIFRVRPRDGVISPEYASALIGSGYGKRYFLRAAKQTTGIATINKGQLVEFPVLLPPYKKQLEYEELVETYRALVSRSEHTAKVEHNLFNSLVQRAFRGELSPVEVP